MQGPAVEEEQGVDLRHGAVHAPGRAHFSPVDDKFAGDGAEFHRAEYTLSLISVKTEIKNNFNNFQMSPRQVFEGFGRLCTDARPKASAENTAHDRHQQY